MIGDWRTPCDTGLQNGGLIVGIALRTSVVRMNTSCCRVSDEMQQTIDWRYYDEMMLVKTHGDVITARKKLLAEQIALVTPERGAIAFLTEESLRAWVHAIKVINA